jgi:hypothetical protein
MIKYSRLRDAHSRFVSGEFKRSPNRSERPGQRPNIKANRRSPESPGVGRGAPFGKRPGSVRKSRRFHLDRVVADVAAYFAWPHIPVPAGFSARSLAGLALAALWLRRRFRSSN